MASVPLILALPGLFHQPPGIFYPPKIFEGAAIPALLLHGSAAIPDPAALCWQAAGADGNSSVIPAAAGPQTGTRGAGRGGRDIYRDRRMDDALPAAGTRRCQRPQNTRAEPELSDSH